MRHGSAVLLACLLAACAGPADIAQHPVSARFESALSAQMLAACIDANGDKLARTPGVYRSMIRNMGGEPTVVIVEDTVNDLVVAKVDVVTRAQGSAAEFRFAGLGAMTGASLNRLVAGCG